MYRDLGGASHGPWNLCIVGVVRLIEAVFSPVELFLWHNAGFDIFALTLLI
jgi:hypothetical protein